MPSITRLIVSTVSRLALRLVRATPRLAVSLAWAWVVIPGNNVAAVVFYGLVGAVLVPIVPRLAIALVGLFGGDY